jgi:FAD/FMN-containing dehydrogenase/Fe-S oxidoreductase
VDVVALHKALSATIEGEVRFDQVSRAIYATDASVYEMIPLGVVVPATRRDLEHVVEICRRYRCPLTMRGGGTSQAGQAIGAGLIVDTSKYLNRILEIDAGGRWARVEPGVVLEELNRALQPYGLRFAPDVSTANRATIGGMIANNSSGARSVLYGKTIDHVLELELLLSDGSPLRARPLAQEEFEQLAASDSLAGHACRTVRRLALELRAEIERRYPKLLRRVGGYNLDEFVDPARPFDLSKLIVGSEGTLAVVTEATLKLEPLPKAKAVLSIEFEHLLDALTATPLILKHQPSAVEVMDKFILDHTRENPDLERLRRSLISGDPGALLCVEFYDEQAARLPGRMEAVERELMRSGFRCSFCRALALEDQARIWSLREAALGLSMAMKGDAKSLSFVEDTAVAPEKLRDYIERFLQIVQAQGTQAGVYAHASVGCLHVRPVVNLKTEDGVARFERIAEEIADLVLEFGGALSGEHGDGLVRSPFMRKMFGPALYDAFCQIKAAFDPQGILNPGKIVGAPPLTANLRFGAGYCTPRPETFFDFSGYGGWGDAVEMCSGLGACRKKLDGVMCPSYMATLEEKHSTRGRANALRLAMNGRMQLSAKELYEALDLCLECRACRNECPVGVDMARFKSEFLATYWSQTRAPLSARVLGHVHSLAALGARWPRLSNFLIRLPGANRLQEKLFGIDRRRPLPQWAEVGLEPLLEGKVVPSAAVQLFGDTFTRFYEPAIGAAVVDILLHAGVPVSLAANVCCGRPLISKGFLAEARELAKENVRRLYEAAADGARFVVCEPSCLSALREDVPLLLRGEAQKRAETVARACLSFEELAGELPLNLKPGPQRILFHTHCHQRSMGSASAGMQLLRRIPGAEVIDSAAGCCGMAGSFGYTKDHYEISRAIGERRLLPAVRMMSSEKGNVIVAPGTSCRRQVYDFAGARAYHPAELVRRLL